ncbi:methyltransferase domain-containing protein [Planctomicrobium sp. SH527]|uniref:methyltransferase domain-containing protein n=1 Tax=Planctomicrobium sp. SH527 TaxID=3448123 RepID=UPI003F5C9000
MSIHPIRMMSLLLLTCCLPGIALAQEKSVKPGINDTFRNPNAQEFVERFEIESREVFHQRQKILEACQIQPGQTVADIGAGTGLFTRMFSGVVGDKGRVIAVDIAKEFLDHIKATSAKLDQKNVETVLCTADSTELPENSVDVAFICDTYHHFEFPLKTMASLRRALKPGGRVIVVDYHRILGKTKEWTLNHVRAGQDVFESEIVESGFLKTREVTGVLEENYLVEFTKSATPGLKPPQYPIIAGYGGVVAVTNAVEKPRPGAKLLLDVTAAAPADAVHKGLERAARLLNLYGAAGLKASDIKLVVVFHGEATKSVLKDEFYQAKFGVERNPNLPLIKLLQEAGVEIFVCGQALNYKGFPESSVEKSIPIADSALSVIANRQMDGYGYLPIH